MLIDWFTVVAQAINFLVLVWLMKRFLYGPILRAIAAREEKIAAQLEDADSKRAAAQQERDEFAEKNTELDRQRSELIIEATNDASELRERLIREARQAAEELTLKLRESRRSEVRNLNSALIQRTQQEVFSIARRVLADLAGASLEERMAEIFAQRVREADGNSKAEIIDGLKTSSGVAVVRSAFPVGELQRTCIQDAIDNTLATQLRLRFEVAPELISGIELTAGGKKIAWSIEDYLSSLEDGVKELLHYREDKRSTSGAKSVEESSTRSSEDLSTASRS